MSSWNKFISRRFQFAITLLLVSIVITGCSTRALIVTEPAEATPTPEPVVTVTSSPTTFTCPITEPVWVKPPADSAVQNEPDFGYYYINVDRSIWASAWWHESEEFPLTDTKEGIKVGWFRPAGAELVISGQRIDGEAPPLEAHASCCYPTRFQASGLYFPAPGCWEVTAKAAESELNFIVQVESAEEE